MKIAALLVTAIFLSSTAFAEDPRILAKQQFDASAEVKDLEQELLDDGYAELSESVVNAIAHHVLPDEDGNILPGSGDYIFMGIKLFRKTVAGGGFSTVSIVGNVRSPGGTGVSSIDAEIIRY